MLRENLFKMVDFYYVIKGNRSAYDILRELTYLKSKDRKTIDEIVFKKLENMLKHSFENVAYYNDCFQNSGFDPHSFSISKMDKLPVLTKKIIRDNFPGNITAPQLKSRAIYNTTSGSTGQPLEFYNDVSANPYHASSYMFFNTLMGVPPLEIHWNLKSLGKSTRRQDFNNWVQGKHLYSVMDVNEENLSTIVGQIDRIRPTYIEGYAGSLIRLAKLLHESSHSFKHKPRATIATSEMLTDSSRGLVEEVFGGEVYNRYGSREFSGAVAQECSRHDGLHINPLLAYVEIVDDDGLSVGEGEKGKVLITDLNNYFMPFIRYEIGDMAVKGSDGCSCGMHFLKIDSLQGRSGDFIIDADDEKIPFVTVSAHLFRRHYAPHVISYQFEQKRKGEITLKVVPSPNFNETVGKEIERTLQEILPGFRTEFLVVDDIPPEPTGKTPFLKKIRDSF